jgi:hypothetical protein
MMDFLLTVNDKVCHVIADGVEVWIRPENNLIVIKTDGSRSLATEHEAWVDNITIEVSPRLDEE